VSKQMDALLIIAECPPVTDMFRPIVNRTTETIHWDQLDYPKLNQSQKIAAAWAYVIWSDARPPESWADPFHDFHTIPIELRGAILRSYETRQGFTHFEIESDDPLHVAGSEAARLNALYRLAEYPKSMHLIDPYVEKKVPPNQWKSVGLSGGQKTVLSWAYAIRMGKMPAKEGWRDPFDGFSIMDEDMQIVLLKALAEANGFSLFEAYRTKGALEAFLTKMGEKLSKE
jgi:hypothetical protein